MSKLSKLLSDPKRFATDSTLYRRFSLFRALTETKLRESAGLAWTPVGSGDQLQAELLTALGDRLPVLDLSEPGTVTIATLKDHVHDLTEFLWSLQQRPDIEVVLQVSRKRLRLRDAQLLTVDAFVRSSPAFVARIHFEDRQECIHAHFELWSNRGNFTVGPKKHLAARRIPNRVVEQQCLFRKSQVRHARELHQHRMVDEPDFPIDVVYTWVNHLDPQWQRLRAQATGTTLEAESDDGKSLDRFFNRDELRYSLRSVAQFAPWVRAIFIATNCAPPDWLDVEHPKLRWVDHSEFMPTDALPTFSSHAIESRLQHIPGLEDNFLYFNDDFFLTRRCVPGDFFAGNGLSRSFLEGYGTVIGDVHEDDADYLNAARNGKRLLEETFQRSATSLHKHLPYALRKDVLLEMEERFERSISRTTRNQFRALNDISTVSFLYHHYAFLTGRALYETTDAWLIKPTTRRYERRLGNLLAGKSRPIALCLNDGAGSSQNPHWGKHVKEFLEAFFPTPCEFER